MGSLGRVTSMHAESLFIFCCMLHVWILLGIYAPLIGVLCGASVLVFDLFY
jgi:hypothetical protein